MLHGRGGNRENWVEYGLIEVADQQISTGNIRPMIIVLPQGESGYWTNHTADGPRWGDYVYDIVDFVDISYRTIPSTRARAIGGLSMGGWGALLHGFTRPDVFSVVGAHSPAFRPDDGSIGFLGRGEEYKKKNPMDLSLVQPNLGSLQIWVDTGDQDPWVDRAKLFHSQLLSRGINHVWLVYPGSHETWFWHEHSLDYIRFYGLALMKR
jgi:enterochelin esterase-like enzyme